MGEAIWTTVTFRTPASWGDDNQLVVGLGDALLNGETSSEDDDGVLAWTIAGEGNYGLADSDVECWLDWMRSHRVPFIASDEPKYEYDGSTHIFNGHREWSGTSTAEQAVLSKAEYDSIVAGTSEFRSVSEFFEILNSSSCADFPIDHLPANFPDGNDRDTGKFMVLFNLQAPSLAHAEIVAAERTGYDETYTGPDGEPFDYQITVVHVAEMKEGS